MCKIMTIKINVPHKYTHNCFIIVGTELEELVNYSVDLVREQSKESYREMLINELTEGKISLIDVHAGQGKFLDVVLMSEQLFLNIYEKNTESMRVAFINAKEKGVEIHHIEISFEILFKFLKTGSLIVETVGYDEMLIKANPMPDEQKWTINNKTYQGDAILYGKVSMEGESGIFWDLENIEELINFL